MVYMNEAKQALLNYKIYFRDGNEAEVLDKYHDPDFESKILNGLIPVYDNDGKAVLSARQTSIELCRFTIPCSARIVTIDLSFMLVITSANTVNYELGYQLRKFKLMTSSKRVNSPKFYLQTALKSL